MRPIAFLWSLWHRIEEKFEKRGREAFDPDKDSDIRKFRMQRRQSEMQAHEIRNPRPSGNPIADRLRPSRDWNDHG